MNNRHEVISAFLDEDPYDLADLAAALNEPDGRALLIDLLALRRIVQPTDPIPVTATVRPARRLLRPVLAAAAVIVALVGGYAMGASRASTVDTAAPPPTRIVQVTSTGPGQPSEVR